MKRLFAFVLASMFLMSCVSEANTSPSDSGEHGTIYLYGESHGNADIINEEYVMWYNYYHNDGMRHLFVEYSYFTAEFLNEWIKSDSDEILDQIYTDWDGTQGQVPAILEFFRKIKENCPETVFHGTDVGHQHDTIGTRFLNYLTANGREESEQYTLTQEAIEQGRRYYSRNDDKYRENMMAENFIREFDKLDDESIMGIYGAAHTYIGAKNHTNQVDNMATQLYDHYGDIIVSEDISLMAQTTEPIRVDTLTVGGKEYAASYFGEQDLTAFKDYTKREFWRLEDAYDDFKDARRTSDVLPYNNYPMQIQVGQVFVIEMTKNDGSTEVWYYRSDGAIWNGAPVTENFKVK